MNYGKGDKKKKEEYGKEKRKKIIQNFKKVTKQDKMVGKEKERVQEKEEKNVIAKQISKTNNKNEKLCS